MFIQIVNLFLTSQLLVAGQGDDLYSRGHDKEGHVETDLVVASSCGAMGDSVGTDFFCIAGDGYSLENTLTAN